MLLTILLWFAAIGLMTIASLVLFYTIAVITLLRYGPHKGGL